MFTLKLLGYGLPEILIHKLLCSLCTVQCSGLVWQKNPNQKNPKNVKNPKITKNLFNKKGVLGLEILVIHSLIRSLQSTRFRFRSWKAITKQESNNYSCCFINKDKRQQHPLYNRTCGLCRLYWRYRRLYNSSLLTFDLTWC